MAQPAPVIKQLPTTVFDRMEFPDYEYQEFPMAVPYVNGAVQKNPYDARGKSHPVVMVNSQEEYDALVGGEAKVVPVNPEAAAGPSRVETEDDERAALLVRAGQLGIKVDGRWSIERIEKAISDAETV